MQHPQSAQTLQIPDLKTVYTCFPGGKHKVLTFSYDDGRQEDRRLVALFNQYGLRGTFNLNSGILSDPRRVPPSEYKTLYAGHEIACHTYRHPTIARCPSPLILEQVMQDRRSLERITGAPVRGLAYPNGSYDQRIIELLPMTGIRYARTVTSTASFAMPQNFLAWDPTCHHSRNLQQRGEEFLALHKTQYLYMLYVWGHSYEFGEQDNWHIIEDFAALMAHQPDIWYATNIEIADYMQAAEQLQFTAAADAVYNPSFASVWISVDGRVIEVAGGQLVQL